LAAQAIVDSTFDYRTAVAKLYRQRARTNRRLRSLLYHDRLARCMLAGLTHWPAALNRLAANVLGE
jgi:hypothetical protein